jgi:hypothetical protein
MNQISRIFELGGLKVRTTNEPNASLANLHSEFSADYVECFHRNDRNRPDANKVDF